ncbi:hypothetical protein HDIA_1162 [Hartmannibacter diazotrophicus]|uniref:Uncharacterized protein n=1 Tax=Hartmannibacter diazotrophicus TaxID=1482074 RepID=A0A2C9D396_9HYPH|nr:hypothetical protein [Hartmannibacter diazotrophicus]SON54703.1 hypothetical protein HDIA_1162 [Hartmannibacter diazotrophicus]
MPPLATLAAVGLGLYIAARVVARMNQVKMQPVPAKARRVVKLERDPETGVYRPSDR